MNPEPPKGLPGGSLDREDNQRKRSWLNYVEPWIVNLLREYKAPQAREDGQFGHVLKVLNDGKTLPPGEECAAVVLRIADKSHYIRVVVEARALQMTTRSLPQAGFSNIVGQFIILQNYTVCFKEATNVEDCEFYLTLSCFRVIPIKKEEMKQQDCNREPSVLQRIKELWQKSFALQPLHNSAPSSVSTVLQEMKEDKLNTLKQNVKDCLGLLDSINQLNSEQLAEYPETKWQVERKQDKVHQDIFTVPAKHLVISAENEEILRKCYPQTESESLDGSLGNPWDICPAMTLTSSSDISGTPPGLPHIQEMPLARTAEEETQCSSSCTPDFLESCAHRFHCNSEQIKSAEAVSPPLFPSQKKASPKEPDCCDSIPLELNNAHNTSKMPGTYESIPCCQQLKNSHSHTTVSGLSPVNLPMVNDSSLGPLLENTLEDNMHCLCKNKMVVTEAKGETLDRGRKGVAVKRKQIILDEGKHEVFTTPTHTRQKSVGYPSTKAFVESNTLDKVRDWKLPLEFVSTPKKSRTEKTQVQHCPTVESNRVQHLYKYTETHQEKERKQGTAEGTTGNPEQQIGVQEQERVRRPPFCGTYEPPTPEICSQVRSTRISRALLGWARWVFSNLEGQ
ncbi:uncharacterized protein LOC121914302 isoform X2 [Sceloporus undulatus]|uniref:uncharacterized protein LOC121914302 isoform X2 n=1 Tax=Sceloporus undulatus TaxID=8520 RepID=UPI001C4B3D02|nr:uncharacterized protein LOC121914302 isoform X2 [Sceloporus undulatus]